MGEQDIIDRTKAPITVRRLHQDFRSLGIHEGDRLLVHAALSKIGWVCGGPQAVVQALLEAVGEQGTLVMPAHSGDWSDPAEWENPPVPDEWIATIYREMPAFDAALTPTRGMGRIAELFRTFPGTIRSGHPQVSFCAKGQQADLVVSNHALTPQFGMSSPLGRMYDLQAKVLLLGVGYDSCTSFHLAEALVAGMPMKRMGAAMAENGQRVWKWFADLAYDSEDFMQIGAQFEEQGQVKSGKAGDAECKLFNIRDAVDFAKLWMQKHRLSGS